MTAPKPAPSTDPVYEDRGDCYLCGAPLGRDWLQLPSSREGHPVYICKDTDGCKQRGRELELTAGETLHPIVRARWEQRRGAS